MDCIQSYFVQIEFWEHLSVHYSADKLYRCDRCPFRTPLKHHMTSHRMNHDDDKPFSCEFCSYRAVSQSMVNSHKKSHSTVRPYVCDYPRCHYSTKFVNQLTRHREKQHPGFTSSPDGRRLRQSGSLPPSHARHLPYTDDRVAGLPPSVLPQTTSAVAAPPLPDELTGRNAATMLPWSMPPPWSPFNFLQRMAAAAAVSGLPLGAASPIGLSAQRPADVKAFQLPSSTLPTSSQSMESIPVGEHGSTSTPRKPASAVLDGRRDAVHAGMSSSPVPPTHDADARKSFWARLAAAGAGSNNRMNVAGNDVSAGAPVFPQTPAPTAADNNVLWQLSKSVGLMPASPRLRSNVDGVANDQHVRSRRDLSKYANITGKVEHTQDDDSPLDLTAKTSFTPVHSEYRPEVYQPVADRTDTVDANSLSQLPVRKTSRRKGIAHKLDATAVNEWPGGDVTDETFDLVPAGGAQMCQRSSPSPRGETHESSSCAGGKNVDKTTKNEAEGEGSSTEKDHITASVAGLERQVITAQVTGEEEDHAAAGGSLECTEAGRATLALSSQECRHCGFVFKHPAMFDIHMGFHKFDEPWRCNRCGHRCNDCVDFNRHIAAASHHGQV